MKQKLLSAIFIVICCLSISCNRYAVLSGRGKNSAKKYDSTAFDYVFTEALKQKLMSNAGDALKYLEQCIKVNPKSDAAYYEMAQIALMLGDKSNGEKFALKAVSLNEKNIWYLTMLADIYYQEKKTDSAILFYEKAVKYFPEKDNIKLNLAGIYSENRQYDKASDLYSSLEQKYGVNETTTLAAIKNLMNCGNYTKAEEQVNKLLKKSPDDLLYNGLIAEIYRNRGEKEKAMEVYNKLVKTNPSDPQTLLYISDFLINEKQYDELFPVLNKIVLNDSIAKENKIAIFSRIISDSALIGSKANETELTLIVLEANYKNDAIVVLLRPELYQNEGNTSNAIKRLEEIISEQPDNPYAWERLLVLYSDIKDWDRLLVRGEECATKFNRSFVAKVLYADAAMEKGKLSVAEEELRKAKILAGSDTNMLIQVLVMDADVLYRKKEYSKSFETFKEALKIKPDDSMILNNYAYYLAEQGLELKEAEKMSKKVIDREKGNTTYLDTYAWVLYKQGRYKEAGKIMETIISSDNKADAEWYEHTGYIMKALKNCDKAVEYWNRAIQIDNRKSSLTKEIENCRKR